MKKIRSIITSSSLLLAGIGGFVAPVAAHADSVTVKSGDTASAIANDHHVSLDTLQNRNQGVDLNVLTPGQTLNITPDTYTVKAGDTLSEIASKKHVSVDDLKKFNNLDSDLITVGQKLKLSKSGQVTKTVVATPTVNNNVANTTTTTQTTQPTYNQSTPTTNYVRSQNTSNVNTNVDAIDGWAKNWIANRESSGSYTASNGNYYGKYQLNKGLLHGDYSAANQEKVATQYVNSRYGSWSNAQKFWAQNGWY